MMPAHIGLPANHRVYYPIYAKCVELGVPVKINCGVPGPLRFAHLQRTINLDEVYTQLIRRAEQRELEGRAATRLEEQFQLFLVGALALLALEAMIGERSRA